MHLESLHARFFDRSRHRADAQYWCDSSDQGMVTSAHYLASATGAEALRRGGNAIDAAIATSFALGVCEPAGSGMGGMAMMVVHLADENRVFTVESPCRAPKLATPENVARSHRYRGHAAIAVPTHVAAMNHLHTRYGTLSIAELLAPAIEIAEEGFPVTSTLQGLISQYVSALRKHTAGQFFLKQGEPPAAGERLRQPVLARTLRQLADRGLEDFYVGEIGRRIADDLQAGGGFVDAADLQEPPEPVERAPLTGNLAGDVVHTVGPPGGGLALAQLSQLFSVSGRQALHLDRPQDAVLLASMIRRVREDRRRYRLKQLADAPGEAAQFLEADYNRSLMNTIDRPASQDAGETTHVSVMDRWGNAVALTQSIERSFGSAVATEELGFCYNGYLRAFKVENRRHPYYLQPGAPARSNACPTIVTRHGRPVVLIGSTGSERMVSGVFCTLMRLRSGAEPFSASHGARLHCTPEGVVVLEGERFPSEVLDALTAAGFELDMAGAYDFRMGGLQLVVAGGSLGATRATGVADPRRDGGAISPAAEL